MESVQPKNVGYNVWLDAVPRFGACHQIIEREIYDISTRNQTNGV